MKKGLLFILFSFLFVFVQGQDIKNTSVNIGDTFVIGDPSNSQYKHLKLPRPNFIIKKGGIVNFKSLKNTKVKVVAVRTKNEKSYVTIRRSDGGKFFGSHPTLNAYLEESLEQGELVHSN